MANGTKKPEYDFETYGIPPERLEEIRAQARKAYEDEQRKKLELKFLRDESVRVRREHDPVYEERDILLDLPPHADRITLDGQEFHHGMTYTVTKPVYDVFMDIIARGWAHEREIGHANRDMYRPPMQMSLSGRSGLSASHVPQHSASRFH